MDDVLDRMPFPWACGAFVALNLFIFATSMGGGLALRRIFAGARIAPGAAPLGAFELLAAVTTLALNTALGCAGLWLYRRGWIHLRRGLSPQEQLLDLALFFFAIDVLMYALHRLAHVRPIYDLLHALHHRYENPNALTLYVLHPVEAIGFGSLWIVLLALHDFSLGAFVAYNVLNVYFGVVGHFGFEPYPTFWTRSRLTSWITTSTFHFQHHRTRVHNLGFYTTFWDRLFGTLHPSYREEFAANASRFWSARHPGDAMEKA